MKLRTLVSTLALWSVSVSWAAELKGLWEFDNPADLSAATAGNPLIIGGVHTHHAALADDHATSLSGAITTQGGLGSYFTANPDLPANGGGAYVNQFSFVVDLFSPAGSRGIWRAILQTTANPTGNDADYWISPANNLGVADLGYTTGTINESVWTRLVVTMDLTAAGGDVVTYLDGSLFYSHPNNPAVDGRFSLYPVNDTNVVHFFADDMDAENPPMNVGLIAIYDGVLTLAEVAQLGGAGDPIEAAPARELRWTGAAGGEWSNAILGPPKNWVLASGGTAVDFMDFDNVTFDDSGSVTTVTISSGDVKSGAIAVENDLKDYEIVGANGISDPASLTKNGDAALTIATANSFHGATLLNGGTLGLGNGVALQNSPLTIASGATLDFGSLSAATIGGLSGEGDLILENSEPVPGAVALTVNGGGSYGGILSGSGSLTKSGTGILSLRNTSTFAGAASVTGGMLQLENPGALGSKPVILAGGGLAFSFGDGSSTVFPNEVVLPAAGQPCFVVKGTGGANITTTTTVELSGVISGGAPGEIFRFADTDQTGNHADVVVLSNPANSFQGTIQMWRGTLAITSDEVLGDPGNDIEHYTENVNGAIRFEAPGITLNASRDIYFPGDANPRPFHTQSFDAEIAGTLTGTANLIKQGSGTLTLSGSTFLGGTVEVAEGTLALEGSADLRGAGGILAGPLGVLDVSALGAGFTLFPNLAGDGEVRGEFTAFGAVSPGADSGTIGTLTTGSITLDFFLNMEFDSDFFAADRLVVNGDLNLTSNAELVLLDLAVEPMALPAGTGITLIEYTGAWNGEAFQYFDVFNLIELADGATFTIGPNTFVIDYDAPIGGGNPGRAVTLTVPGGGEGAFASWAESQGLDGSPGKEAGFGENADGGILANGLEWILGGDPLAQDDDAEILFEVEGDALAGLTLTFTREADSVGEATLLVQWNTSLGAVWNDVPIGATSSGPDANGVTVMINDLADPDEVTVHIPAANAVDGKIFARLMATLP